MWPAAGRKLAGPPGHVASPTPGRAGSDASDVGALSLVCQHDCQCHEGEGQRDDGQRCPECPPPRLRRLPRQIHDRVLQPPLHFHFVVRMREARPRRRLSDQIVIGQFLQETGPRDCLLTTNGSLARVLSRCSLALASPPVPNGHGGILAPAGRVSWRGPRLGRAVAGPAGRACGCRTIRVA
jgi:hypothetical protein